MKSKRKSNQLQKASIEQKKQQVQKDFMKYQKMNDIFSVLNQQEETITALINKYQSNSSTLQNVVQKNSQIYNGNHKDLLSKNKSISNNLKHNQDRTYQEKVRMELFEYRKSKSLSKKKSKSKLTKFQLPIIKSNQKNIFINHSNNKVLLSVVSQKGPQSSISKIGYLGQKQKPISFKKQLQKIYAQNGRRIKYKGKNRNNSRLKSKQRVQYQDEIVQQKSRYRKNKQTNSDTTTLTPQQINSEQGSIPNPIAYYTLPKPPVRQSQNNIDSDSQEQQIPLTYYQRQFKEKLRGQCIEQINYLYFSKNESIKQWSQSLLGMFQKHDKELLALRNKTKYLKKFDDNFFAVDIYKN